jgi:hypothetical protein
LDQELQCVGGTGQLGEFLEHIGRVATARPHVLVAYSYILHMALFAGGRFIRASLESAGEEFWARWRTPHTEAGDNREHHTQAQAGLSAEEGTSVSTRDHYDHGLPLRFFHFGTLRDGEDLKTEYKDRLSDLESILTTGERLEIIQEATSIFENMVLLVEQLDNVCGTPTDGLIGNGATFMPVTIGSRLRDSIVLAKERNVRRSTRSTDSEDSQSSAALTSETSSVAAVRVPGFDDSPSRKSQRSESTSEDCAQSRSSVTSSGLEDTLAVPSAEVSKLTERLESLC